MGTGFLGWRCYFCVESGILLDDGGKRIFVEGGLVWDGWIGG